MHPTASRQLRHDAWRLARVLLVVACVGVVLWDPVRPAPAIIYERACAVLPSDPFRAKLMFRMAVADAGGDFPDAQAQLCLIAIRAGDANEVRRLCASLRWRGAHSESLRRLGYAALGARQTEPARQAHLELSRRDGSDSLFGWQGLATLFSIEKKTDQVVACLEEITRLAPEDPRPWKQLAAAHEEQHNPAAAAAAYRRALEHIVRRRDEIAVRHQLVARLLDAGELAAAGEEIDRLAARDDRQERVEPLRERLKRLLGSAAPAPEKVDAPLYSE